METQTKAAVWHELMSRGSEAIMHMVLPQTPLIMEETAPPTLQNLKPKVGPTIQIFTGELIDKRLVIW